MATPLASQFTSCGQADNLRTQFNALRTLVNTLLNGDGLITVPTLAIGTVSKKEIKITGAFNVMVDGRTFSEPAQEVAFTATTHDIADPDANPREAYFILSIDGAGAVTITKGSDAAAGLAVLPSTPAGEVRFGYVLIQHDGTLPFDATTNDLDAAHLTVTYTDEPSPLADTSLALTD
jgi:hypothetical protein